MQTRSETFGAFPQGNLDGRHSRRQQHRCQATIPARTSLGVDYNACYRMTKDAKSGCFFRTVADRSPESLSDFLKRWNQLGNINANHCAFAQPALDIELKIRSVEHAQPLPHVAQPDSFYINVRQFFFRDAHTVIFNLDAEP